MPLLTRRAAKKEGQALAQTAEVIGEALQYDTVVPHIHHEFPVDSGSVTRVGPPKGFKRTKEKSTVARPHASDNPEFPVEPEGEILPVHMLFLHAILIRQRSHSCMSQIPRS